MNCTIRDCPGDYEDRLITHTVKNRGRVLVIDHVPAEVCSICGDVLFSVDTVRHIEILMREDSQPVGQVPLYEYA